MAIHIGLNIWFLSCIKAWCDELEKDGGSTAKEAKAANTAAPTAVTINVTNENTNTNANPAMAPQQQMY